jgi:hypothetical protein
MLLHRWRFRHFCSGHFWGGHNIYFTVSYIRQTRLSLLLTSVTFLCKLIIYTSISIFNVSNLSLLHKLESSSCRNAFYSDLQKMFRTQSVGTFIIYLDLQFHIPLDTSIRPTCQYYGCMFLFFLITYHVNRMKKYGRLTSLIIDYHLLSSVTIERDYGNSSIQSRHTIRKLY